MKLIQILAPVAVSSLLAFPVAAADRGVNEMAGTFSYSDIEDTTTTTLELSYGRYLTPMHEVGLTGAYAKTEVGNESIDGTQLGVFYNLNFDMYETLVPYLGVDLVTLGGDAGDLYDLGYGVSAGLKLYPYEHVGVLMSISYLSLQGAEDWIEDANGTNVNVGLSVRF